MEDADATGKTTTMPNTEEIPVEDVTVADKTTRIQNTEDTPVGDVAARGQTTKIPNTEETPVEEWLPRIVIRRHTEESSPGSSSVVQSCRQRADHDAEQDPWRKEYRNKLREDEMFLEALEKEAAEGLNLRQGAQ